MKRWIMLRLWILLEQYFEKGNYRFDYRDRIDLQKRHKKYNEQKRISKTITISRISEIEKKKVPRNFFIIYLSNFFIIIVEYLISSPFCFSNY